MESRILEDGVFVAGSDADPRPWPLTAEIHPAVPGTHSASGCAMGTHRMYQQYHFYYCERRMAVSCLDFTPAPGGEADL